MITIRIYRLGKKLKARYLAKRVSKSSGGNFTNEEILDEIRNRPTEDVVCVDVHDNNKDVTAEVLTKAILARETTKQKENLDLHKIIKAGGFIEYIRQLEGDNNEPIKERKKVC